MSTPQPSTGPPAPRTSSGKFAQFAQAVVDADGEWVEQDAPDVNPTVRTVQAIGQLVAEVRQRDGVVYARMRR